MQRLNKVVHHVCCDVLCTVMAIPNGTAFLFYMAEPDRATVQFNRVKGK